MLRNWAKRFLPESARAWSRRIRAGWIARLAGRTNLTREPLAYIFLHGEGIEIGALNNPLHVSRTAKVRFVDRLPTEALRQLYVDVNPRSIREVDLVTDGETLQHVADDSQDFVISNHMVEHAEDPIGTLRHVFRVLKTGGVLFLTLPNKDHTFDKDRPVTPFEHVKTDYRLGPEWSRLDHYREWLRVIDGVTAPNEIETRALALAAERANIHFHVWDQAAMMEMLGRMQRDLGFKFDVEVMSRTGLEVIFVIRKTGPVPSAPQQ